MTGEEIKLDQRGKDDLPSELESAIKNIAEKEGYVVYKIITKKTSTGGANYTGELFEVDIKGKTAKGDKETNLFIKKGISDDILEDLVEVSGMYKTEKFAYKELAKLYEKMQNEANIPETERYKMVKSYDTESKSAIVMENLAKKEFKIPYRMDVMSLKFTKLSIEQLAKFHALNFALEIKYPEFFEEKVRPLKFCIKSDEKDDWKNMARLSKKQMDPIYKQKVEHFERLFYEKFSKYHYPENSSVSCLSHGDFRGSNILKRDVDGETVEIIPVDYQCLYYGCPINDFLFFMACGSDRKLRLEHYEDLKDLYHDTLTNFLKYFDIDSNDVFPRKKMEQLFEDRRDYMAMIAVIGFPFIFSPENVVDISTESIMKADFDLDERYKQRLIDIMDECTV